MPADNPTSRRNTGGDDTYTALFERRYRAQRELDEAVAIMNADAYLMTSRLPNLTAIKDRAVHELTAALTALKAAKRGGDEAQIERGQWSVIDAARALCQVTGSNIVELGDLMAAALASYNTVAAHLETAVDTHEALTLALDDLPPTRNTDDTAE
jgi:hypothetical protein